MPLKIARHIATVFCRIIIPMIVLCLGISHVSAQGDLPSNQEIKSELRRAVAYFTEEVSSEGGYLWEYSADLSRRDGENRADENMVWIQPPGTPFIGRVLLKAWRTTGDEYYLDAAHKTGTCLVRCQLESGCWTHSAYLDAERRTSQAYRTEEKHSSRAKNMSTFDDNSSQCALAFLVELDRELKFSDPVIHEATIFALDSMLAAQRPNGGWPQGFDAPCKPEDWPALKASYPPEGEDPSRIKEYWHLYTFNDNLFPDLTFTLLLAHRIYGDQRYLDAVKRSGDFILAAQMPDPQPAWAQQYDPQMRPTWARKFEPASITGGESQGIMKTLMSLYIETGERRYLQPIPKAIEYLRSSLLPDGRLARFYEMRTNRPLYFTKDYTLTYSDADMPTHYSFKVGSSLDSIEAQYKKTIAMTDDTVARNRESRWAYLDITSDDLSKASDSAKAAAAKVIAQLDDHGRWIEEDIMIGTAEPQKVVKCSTFAKNIETLLKAIDE
mgnify:CR=1 FL=1